MDDFQERRRHPRMPTAYAFWFRPEGGGWRSSAWLLNRSEGGAAFLVDREQLPAAGTRVSFSEMHCTDRMVREGCPPLPRAGRVLRCDEADGVTGRVAVQFEADVPAVVGGERMGAGRAALRGTVSSPVPVPADATERGMSRRRVPGGELRARGG